jgi:hypothetical protein
MSSEDAKNVAKEVLETLGKGKKVILGKIAIKNGYAKNTADNPLNITETKSYQGVISPIVEQLELERQRLLTYIKSKKLSNVNYSEAIRSLDIITKNIQLLSGGKTENIGVSGLTEEQKTSLLGLIK